MFLKIEFSHLSTLIFLPTVATPANSHKTSQRTNNTKTIASELSELRLPAVGAVRGWEGWGRISVNLYHSQG